MIHNRAATASSPNEPTPRPTTLGPLPRRAHHHHALARASDGAFERSRQLEERAQDPPPQHRTIVAEPPRPRRPRHPRPTPMRAPEHHQVRPRAPAPNATTKSHDRTSNLGSDPTPRHTRSSKRTTIAPAQRAQPCNRRPETHDGTTDPHVRQPADRRHANQPPPPRGNGIHRQKPNQAQPLIESSKAARTPAAPTTQATERHTTSATADASATPTSARTPPARPASEGVAIHPRAALPRSRPTADGKPGHGANAVLDSVTQRSLAAVARAGWEDARLPAPCRNSSRQRALASRRHERPPREPWRHARLTRPAIARSEHERTPPACSHATAHPTLHPHHRVPQPQRSTRAGRSRPCACSDMSRSHHAIATHCRTANHRPNPHQESRAAARSHPPSEPPTDRTTPARERLRGDAHDP